MVGTEGKGWPDSPLGVPSLRPRSGAGTLGPRLQHRPRSLGCKPGSCRRRWDLGSSSHLTRPGPVSPLNTGRHPRCWPLPALNVNLCASARLRQKPVGSPQGLQAPEGGTNGFQRKTVLGPSCPPDLQPQRRPRRGPKPSTPGECPQEQCPQERAEDRRGAGGGRDALLTLPPAEPRGPSPTQTWPTAGPWACLPCPAGTE